MLNQSLVQSHTIFFFFFLHSSAFSISTQTSLFTLVHISFSFHLSRNGSRLHMQGSVSDGVGRGTRLCHSRGRTCSSTFAGRWSWSSGDIFWPVCVLVAVPLSACTALAIEKFDFEATIYMNIITINYLLYSFWRSSAASCIWNSINLLPSSICPNHLLWMLYCLVTL